MFCGSDELLIIHHVDGDESHVERINLAWACRSCNAKIGHVMKRAGVGRRTRQFNPPETGATSLGQWMTAVFAMKGESDTMSVPAAVEIIRATPAARRGEFAREIWRRRRARGTEVPF